MRHPKTGEELGDYLPPNGHWVYAGKWLWETPYGNGTVLMSPPAFKPDLKLTEVVKVTTGDNSSIESI